MWVIARDIPNCSPSSWRSSLRLRGRRRQCNGLHKAMLNTVQNHSTQVVVIDEILDANEVEAARTMTNHVQWLEQSQGRVIAGDTPNCKS